MKLSEKLRPALIKVGLESQEKGALFGELVRLFVDQKLLQDRDAALTALLEREAKMSTGISRGLALPHGKVTGIRSLLVAMGISKRGIDYQSLDGEPVYVVIMVLAETGNPGPHIETLAEISRLFSLPGFMARLRQAGTAAEVMEIIRQEE